MPQQRDTGNRQQAHFDCGEIDPTAGIPERGKAMNEVSRNVSSGKAKKVFQLTNRNDQCDANGETFDDGLGHKRNEAANFRESARNQDDTSEQGREKQTIEAELLDHSSHDDDERASRPPDLNAASAKKRNEQAPDNGRDQARLGRGTGRDGDGNTERQRDQGNRHSRQGITSEQTPGIILQGREKLWLH